MILQKQHNIFNLFLLFPALCNLSDTLFSDSLHFPQSEDIGLNHSDRLCSELLHDPFCIFGANPFDQPRTQIFFNAKNSRRHRLFPGLCLKLSAIATVHFPVSVDQKHRTNIDIQNRIVAFDIKELGKQLKKIGMLIVQDQIWGRVTQNRSKGKATWYFCDEFHLLLREEQTAAFSCEIWKRFRKWGGIPTGATQNVKDLLSSPEIENILENSDFICLLNQASGDRKILAERLNISPQQLRYVDNSEPGEGLLIYENVILPFKNPIPKNTQLYQIMTTRLGEGATV